MNNEMISQDEYKGDLSLSKDYWVEKSKFLLTNLTEPFSLAEYRLFDTYLSRINPRDKRSARVVFTKSEYEKLLGIKINRQVLEKQLTSLQGKAVSFHDEHGNMERYVLFGVVAFNEQYIVLECNKAIEHLFFDIASSGYLKYQFRNILKLNTTYAISIYNYLLANAGRRKWEISITDFLNDVLLLKNSYYTDYNRLQNKILSKAFESINNSTNITAQYKPGTKGGASGRKVVAIVFEIVKIDRTVYHEAALNNQSVMNNPVGDENIVAVRQQIGYEDLLSQNKDADALDLIVSIMVDVYNENTKTAVINGTKITCRDIKSQFEKIEQRHIEYVFNCIEDLSLNKSVKNKRSYLLSCLYNAPYTIDLFNKKQRKLDECKGKSSIDYEKLSKLSIPDV